MQCDDWFGVETCPQRARLMFAVSYSQGCAHHIYSPSRQWRAHPTSALHFSSSAGPQADVVGARGGTTWFAEHTTTICGARARPQQSLLLHLPPRDPSRVPTAGGIAAASVVITHNDSQSASAPQSPAANAIATILTAHPRGEPEARSRYMTQDHTKINASYVTTLHDSALWSSKSRVAAPPMRPSPGPGPSVVQRRGCAHAAAACACAQTDRAMP